MNSRLIIFGIALAALGACNSTTSPSGGGTGGTSANGGTTSSGGTTAHGGSAGSGGMAATGGTSSSGVKSGSGGVVGTGGNTGTGGVMGSGGTASTGGTTHSGGVLGTLGTGGAVPTGGVVGSGGTVGTGGALATGGALGTGGKVGTGGATGMDGGSTSPSGCTRAMLQTAVDSYLAALKTGNTSGMSLTSSAKYIENGATVALGSGIWATPLTPDLTMNLLDVTLCGSYTEVIAASASHPYVLGARLAIEASTGKISAITVIATDCDDWGFNAATYLKEAKAEQSNTAAGAGWGAVDASDQYTRDELLAGGKAYFAYWGDKTAVVPWGDPCCRTEGGIVTNPDPKPPKGTSSSKCSVGIPDQTMAPKVTDQLADVDYGMVVDFLNMPGPDSHWFRFTKSTDMRYVHTLTVCYVNGTWQCPGTQPTCN